MTTAQWQSAANDAAVVEVRNKRLGVKLGLLAVFMVFFTSFMWWSAGILCDWAGIGLNPNSGPRTEIRMEIPAVQIIDPSTDEPDMNAKAQP